MKILVVDDEDPVRELLCEILEEEGCLTARAAGGAEALALFDTGTFDAVFTDIGMPGMSGWELSHAVRERDPDIPLAVITGWGEAVSDADRVAARVNWVLTKPFTLAQISQITSKVARLAEVSTDGAPLAALVT